MTQPGPRRPRFAVILSDMFGGDCPLMTLVVLPTRCNKLGKTDSTAMLHKLQHNLRLHDSMTDQVPLQCHEMAALLQRLI